MTNSEFFQWCERHDWHYEWSDDHSVWQRGSDDAARLYAESKTSPSKERIYKAWHDHIFSGEPWGKPKQPRPQLKEGDE